MKNPQHIVITGGNSGLGEALAMYYAAPNRLLSLCGRNESRLQSVAAACRARGASVDAMSVDVRDQAAMAAWLSAQDQRQPVDLLIANAGISAGTGGATEEPIDQIKQIFAINIDGVINTVQPLISAMVARKRGQISIVSSLAGFRGLPSSPAYSASKSAVRVYAEGLRGVLAPHGVEVNAVCPGFIRTPMTDVNPYSMPFLMQPDKAAAVIARGLAVNRSRIAFPFGLYFPAWFMTLLSPSLTDPLFARLPAKPMAGFKEQSKG